MELGKVPMLIMVFVMIGILFGVGGTILTQIQGTQTSGTTAYNLTGQSLTALTSIGNWQVTWGVIAAAAVVISLVAGFMLYRSM